MTTRHQSSHSPQLEANVAVAVLKGQETIVQLAPPFDGHLSEATQWKTLVLEHSPEAFEKKTGFGVVINTSFNVRGEPIVCTPEDAYQCFMRTDMDYLVLESFVLDKTHQPAFEDNEDWSQTFPLD